MSEKNLPTIEEVFSWMRKLYVESYAGLTQLEKDEQHMYGTMVTTIVGPMITNQNDILLKAMQLEPGEEWLIAPEFVDEKKYILKPTVKIGVKPGSYTFRTELFAPLLAVTPFDTLEEAVRLVNSLDYGLTSGLQSLDEQEQAYWKNHIMAGNLYINRGITGAIVNRQPFGGMKLSAFGPGLKAGGPNYCMQFMTVTDKPGSTTDYKKSYAEWYEREFCHARNIQPHSNEYHRYGSQIEVPEVE
jgi:RHH-type proline utilization regulon transcriptional repressor/proline dehydrogenase/delta 1-pyrroline-5-carboxylate dehydrogenase